MTFTNEEIKVMNRTNGKTKPQAPRLKPSQNLSSVLVLEAVTNWRKREKSMGDRKSAFLVYRLVSLLRP